MTERFKHMDVEDLSKLIDYIVKHDTGNKTVGDIKTELGLTNEEFNELYTLAMPGIRGYNEGRFWKNAYLHLENGLAMAIAGKNTADKKISIVSDILKCRSISALKKERLKGWGAA
jgi:hypothetical protein